MAYQLKVKYFNSFWLKKVVGQDDYDLDPCPTTIATTSINYGAAPTDPMKTPLPTWPGLPWNPEGDDTGTTIAYPTFPWADSAVNETFNGTEGQERQWFVEEARIRGGYNNTTVDFGVKAYVTEDNDTQEHRISSLIYSGVFNSRTGVNNTNVFSIADSITKSLNPANGSIQKLFATNTNLITFQENKVSEVLVDKDAIYSAEGGGTVTSTNAVLGQVKPYLGEYGISRNPESFATYGYAKYFADQNRGCICRLSRDGITEISSYGMLDFFRDNLAILPDTSVNQSIQYNLSQFIPVEGSVTINVYNSICGCDNIEIGDLVYVFDGVTNTYLNVTVLNRQVVASGDCQVQLSGAVTDSYPIGTPFIFTKKVFSRIVGGWDIHQKYYTLSLQYATSHTGCNIKDPYDTLTFDEQGNGWVSFVDYKPTVMFSVKDRFYSTNGKDLYFHYDETIGNNRNVFYGNPPQPSSIEFVFNPQVSMMKNFNTVSYEGSNGWEITSFIGSSQEFDVDPTGAWVSVNDITNSIPSYYEGEYIDSSDGITYHSGFDRKENRYVANLINNSIPTTGEVVYGEDMSGIKGYYSTVKIQTDSTTDPAGLKELWAVSSNWVMSSY